MSRSLNTKLELEPIDFARRLTIVNLKDEPSHLMFLRITPGARVTDGILLFATICISMVFSSLGNTVLFEVDVTVRGSLVCVFSLVGCSYPSISHMTTPIIT